MYQKILSGISNCFVATNTVMLIGNILCEDTMKLFQRLLVAPAALGLMAPLAVNADVTAVSNDVSSEVIEARVDGIEAQLGEIQAGSFSSTTTLSGKAAFQLGYVDEGGTATNDEVAMTYMYQLNMNTSFTGDDLLYTRIKAGNGGTHWASDAAKQNGTYLSSGHNSTTSKNELDVDKIWYQFPVGDEIKVWVGPLIENYYMLASAPSIYRPVLKQFALGGNGTVYGSSTKPGFGAAWTQSVDDPSAPRFAVSAAYTNQNGAKANGGILDEDGKSALLTKFEYGSPQWQVSAAVAFKENGWSDSYFTTEAGKARSAESSETAIGLRAYWKPDETGAVPSVQLGLDLSNIDDNGAGAEEASGWMVGLMWDDLVADGNRAGVAFGSRVAATSVGAGGVDDPGEDNTVWEAYYSFKVNDGVTITPAIFGGEETYKGDEDISGAVVLTEFRF